MKSWHVRKMQRRNQKRESRRKLSEEAFLWKDFLFRALRFLCMSCWAFCSDKTAEWISFRWFISFPHWAHRLSKPSSSESSCTDSGVEQLLSVFWLWLDGWSLVLRRLQSLADLLCRVIWLFMHVALWFDILVDKCLSIVWSIPSFSNWAMSFKGSQGLRSSYL